MTLARSLGVPLVALICAFGPASAALAARAASEILKEYDATIPPKFDPELRKDAKRLKAFREEMARVGLRRRELAFELFQIDPGNARVAEVLTGRWTETMMNPQTASQTVDEIDRAIPHFREKDQIKTARHMRTIAVVVSNRDKLENRRGRDRAVLRDYPGDPAGATLLKRFRLGARPRSRTAAESPQPAHCRIPRPLRRPGGRGVARDSPENR